MTFEDLIGHKRVISLLLEASKSERLHPVYIFSGPDSIGKRQVALNFAKALNCRAKNIPCYQCPSCKKIENMNSPDVFQVGPAGRSSRIGIDAIRLLKKETGTRPYESKYKVYIVDNAERLTQEAGNSLLKILEEPPPNNIFILLTCAPRKILSTISSRACMIRFGVESLDGLNASLIQKFGLSREEAFFISRYSHGRIGRAINMINEDVAKKKNAAIDRVSGCLVSGMPSVEASEWECKDRGKLREDLSYILTWLRDIFVSKISKNPKYIFNIDRIDETSDIAGRISFESLNDLISKFLKLDSCIEYNVNTKLIVDALICEVMNVNLKD